MKLFQRRALVTADNSDVRLLAANARAEHWKQAFREAARMLESADPKRYRFHDGDRPSISFHGGSDE